MCFERTKIILKVNGKEITMVPFVQKILQNSIEAVVKELDGYTQNGDIEICIKIKLISKRNHVSRMINIDDNKTFISKEFTNLEDFKKESGRC